MTDEATQVTKTEKLAETAKAVSEKAGETAKGAAAKVSSGTVAPRIPSQ